MCPYVVMIRCCGLVVSQRLAITFTILILIGESLRPLRNFAPLRETRP